MTRRIAVVLATAAAAALACASPALGATPFNAGVGFGHDLAVDADGRGHVVWMTNEEPDDRVGYCRLPAGGSACDGESLVLPFPGGPSPNASPGIDAQVFAVEPDTVVILASCDQCGGSAPDKVYRWTSPNNGVNWTLPTHIGSLDLNGQAGYIPDEQLALGVEGTFFQAMNSAAPPPPAEPSLGGGFPFVYSPSAVWNEASGEVVHAITDLANVKYAVHNDATPGEGELNSLADPQWSTNRMLSSPEGDNDETHLSAGPNGVLLSYEYFVPNDNRIALRKLDSTTDSFGAPTYVEGSNSIDDNGASMAHNAQDPSGGIHFVWRSLYDSGRLRYTRSNDGGATWTAVANLATHESFQDPVVEAGPSGTGFAVWNGIGTSTVRVVPIDPIFEPDPAAGGSPGGPGAPGGPGGPGGGGDTTDPTVGGFSAGDRTLVSGAGTTFSFSSSEAGRAVLSFHKRVKGLKVRQRGRRRCVPQTRARLRRLRRSAGSRAAYRRLLRQRSCKAWKRVGVIRREVAAGRNEIVWNGRVAGRRLSPGLYEARLVVRDATGNVSRTERLRFRVQRRRR